MFLSAPKKLSLFLACYFASTACAPAGKGDSNDVASASSNSNKAGMSLEKCSNLMANPPTGKEFAQVYMDEEMTEPDKIGLSPNTKLKNLGPVKKGTGVERMKVQIVDGSPDRQFEHRYIISSLLKCGSGVQKAAATGSANGAPTKVCMLQMNGYVTVYKDAAMENAHEQGINQTVKIKVLSPNGKVKAGLPVKINIVSGSTQMSGLDVYIKSEYLYDCEI